MNVSAVLVTRGNVDMTPVLESVSMFDDIVVYDNSQRLDLGVYGRYAGMLEAKHELIYVQDDDCIVSDPVEIIEGWLDSDKLGIVTNMTPHHQAIYTDSCLIGFGACFLRDLPFNAFRRFQRYVDVSEANHRMYRSECDGIFTALTPFTAVDVPYIDREFASDPDRMWKQPGHFAERHYTLELARKVRDLEQVAA